MSAFIRSRRRAIFGLTATLATLRAGAAVQPPPPDQPPPKPDQIVNPPSPAFAPAAAGQAPVTMSPTAIGAIGAIAFDGFTVFDPAQIMQTAESILPGKGAELFAAWRVRIFEYTWLRTLTNTYADFWQVTEDALNFTLATIRPTMSKTERQKLLDAWLTVRAWPDALPALQKLKARGLKLAFLSDLSASHLDTWIANSGLQDLFENHLSTDLVSAYKPDPRAYQMAIDTFGLPRNQIVFAAFGGWDVAGAKNFGYPTFWVNRANANPEELGVFADGTGRTLQELANFIEQMAPALTR